MSKGGDATRQDHTMGRRNLGGAAALLCLALSACATTADYGTRERALSAVPTQPSTAPETDFFTSMGNLGKPRLPEPTRNLKSDRLAPKPKHPVIIQNDRGGYIVKYIATIERERQSGDEIRIMGKCQSACTLRLALPNACVGKYAQLVFHHASTPAGTAYLREAYPTWVNTWISEHGGLTRKLITMSGREAGKYMRRCV